MFIDFAQELYKKLIENEFIWIYSKNERQLTEDTKDIRLTKQVGAVLYIVNIINLNKADLKTYENDSEVLNSEYIISINIFVTEYLSEQLIQIISESKFEPNSSTHTIPYVVNISDDTFISAKYNIDNVVNISLYIKEALEASKNIDANTSYCLETMGIDTIKESCLKIKSNNNYFTYGLIIINTLIFIIMYLQSKNSNIIELLIKFGANSYSLVLKEKQYWRLFTSMFVHIDILHLMYNNFSLYLFGVRVEKYFGKSKFIFIYFFSGLIGSIMSIIFTISISAGASGAIYGLIGAIFAIIQQKNKEVEGMSFYFITIIAIIGIAFGFLDSSINNYAHMGGLVAGYILGFLLCP